MTKNGVYHFYPSAKRRRELKIKTLGVIFRGASAYHAQKTIAPPKQAVCQFSDENFCRKLLPKNFVQCRKMKCWGSSETRFPKFEAELSHPWGINGGSKFRIFQKCETLNGRSPPEIRPYSRETWGKPISDDSAHFDF